MKNVLITTILAVAFVFANAQEEMTTIWDVELDHKILHTGTGLEGQAEYSYAASDKEMTVFDNKDGSTIWTKEFKELAPKLKKIDELIPFWESDVVFLFQRKAGKDQIACVDMRDGTTLWTTDKYQKVSEDIVEYIKEEKAFGLALKGMFVFIDAKTGEERWTTTKFKGVMGKYLYNKSDNTITVVNFKPSGLGALFSGFKNQIAKINLKNGDIIWENTYIGRAQRKAITREFLYDLALEEDKLILKMNGIQAYDYNTGATLWSAAFTFTPAGMYKFPKGLLRSGIYHAVADPIIDGDDLYVLDMQSKKSQYVKKYDMQTGKLLWTSREIKAAKAIPGMSLYGDKIVLQVGGQVEVQYSYAAPNTSGTGIGAIAAAASGPVEVVGFTNIKPYNVQAFNTSDGTQAWDSERFKKGITNSLGFGEQYIVCSGKSLYSLNVNDGSDKYEVPVSKGGVGLAEMIIDYKDDIIVVLGQKGGISTFSASSGELINKNKYRKSSLYDTIDDIMVMKTEKADIACFDLDDLSFKEFKAKKGAVTTLSRNGEMVYVYEKKTVTKLSTR